MNRGFAHALRRATFVVALAALAACSKDDAKKDDKASDKPAAAASPRDAVIASWKAAKLEPSPLAPANVAFAKDCQSGTLEGLEVLVCNYPSPAEAKAAEPDGLAWVGGTTGAAVAQGAALVVVADRKKADPNGRTINRLMKLAPH